MPIGSWLRNNAMSIGEILKGSTGHRPDPRQRFSYTGAASSPGLNAWTDSRVDQVRAFKHWTYIAISRIADRIASQNPNVGILKNINPRETKYEFNYSQRNKALTPIQHHQDITPVDYNHPLKRLLQDPNDPDTGFDLWYETILFLLLTGNAYWWVPKNKVTGIPAAIWVLPSHWVWPLFDKSGALISYELRPTEGNYLSHTFPADEIHHFRKKSVISKIDGFSPQTAGSQWIDNHLSVERSRYYTFKNGAFPATALEFDPNFFDPSPEDLERIEAKFMARYAGETRAGKPLLIPPGVKFHKLSLMPKEMDYCDSADQLRNNILALYGVPAVIAGIADDLSPNSIMAAHSVFCSIAINPLCRFLSASMTEKLGRAYADENLVIWWDDTTPDDPRNVEEKLKTDLSCLAIAPNEVRKIRGREPYLYGGDDPIMPNVGLVMPWGTGLDANAVNPFSQINFQKPKKPKSTNVSSDFVEEFEEAKDSIEE